MKAYKGDGKTVVDIPDDFKDAAEEARFAWLKLPLKRRCPSGKIS
jgi:hypothetical protein